MVDLQNDAGVIPLVSCTRAQGPRLLQPPRGLRDLASVGGKGQVLQHGQQLLTEMR